MSTVALLSGGIDSTVAMCHQAETQGIKAALYIDYRRGNRAEMNTARDISAKLGVPFKRLSLRGTGLAKMSRAFGTRPAYDTPGLYLAMIGMAGNVAVELGADSVTIGLTAKTASGDTKAKEFTNAASYALGASTGGLLKLGALEAPLINLTRPEVIHRGRALGAPLDKTWSCHHADQFTHCGECIGCTHRNRGFVDAYHQLSEKAKATFGADPTVYV